MSTKKVTKHHGSSSILADHKKVGTRFLPPLAQLNMKATRWVDRAMPELLWQGLLVDKYGIRMDCTPEMRQMVKVVYSERETTDYEPQTPHLQQRI